MASPSGQEGLFSKFKLFEEEDNVIHHPPWFTYSLALFGVLCGIGANLWQVFTSVVAFFTMFTQGEVYQHIAPNGKPGATAAAFAISIMMALAFQLGVLFFVFRVHKEFKTAKVSGADSPVKATAVAMVHHHRLLLAWSALSFAADTIGDFTFINFWTSDPMMELGYTLTLYALSTIILSASLERHWAAKIAYQNWKAFKAYTDLMIQKARAKREGAA